MEFQPFQFFCANRVYIFACFSHAFLQFLFYEEKISSYEQQKTYKKEQQPSLNKCKDCLVY